MLAVSGRIRTLASTTVTRVSKFVRSLRTALCAPVLLGYRSLEGSSHLLRIPRMLVAAVDSVIRAGLEVGDRDHASQNPNRVWFIRPALSRSSAFTADLSVCTIPAFTIVSGKSPLLRPRRAIASRKLGLSLRRTCRLPAFGLSPPG